VSDERLLELLSACTEAFGPSGFEEPARRVVQGYAEELADEVEVDGAGNLIARLGAGGSPPIVLTAHLDEVGLMVSHVEDDGFLRLAPIGGWDPIVLPAQRFSVATDADELVTGVVSSLPPHVTKGEAKVADLGDLALDVGAAGAEAVASLGIDVGSPAVPATRLERLSGDAVAAKALDNRAGCVAVLETLRALRADPPGPEVVAIFTTGEERDGAGAALSARGVDPALVLVVETTIAADLPGVPPHRRVTRMGGGPAITVMDRRWTAPATVVRELRRIAASIDLPVQAKQPNIGGTDASTWRRERPELAAGVVATPCRGIHSSSGVLRLGDLRATVRLLEATVRSWSS
jgi:endoglucanase